MEPLINNLFPRLLKCLDGKQSEHELKRKKELYMHIYTHTMETFSEGGPTPLFGIWKLSHKPNLSHAIFQPILILE